MSNLILASKSAARGAMLKNAGFDFITAPADIDEGAIKDEFKGAPEALAAELAKQKALVLSGEHQSDYIIGSDQILVFGNTLMSKSKTQDEARDKLMMMRGKTHRLISAVCVVHDGAVIFDAVDQADLQMRGLSEVQIEAYLNAAGDAPMMCVGGYALESLGGQLFETISGDYFTILGMPLLPLIGFLQSQGFGVLGAAHE